MRLRFPLTAALVAVLALRAAADDKTYDLKLESKPKAGQKVHFTSDETTSQALKVTVGGKVVEDNNESETKHYEGDTETRKVDGELTSEATSLFSKAVHSANGGEEESYGFEGQAVTMTRDEDGTRSYAYEDGSALEEEDEAAIRDALGEKKDKKDHEKSKIELFRPKAPVKVGESWSPDKMEIAKDLMGEDSMDFDADKSSAVFTLKSVELRNGVEFAKVEGTIDLMAIKMGPAPLDTAIPVKITLLLNFAVDGSIPDGEMSMTMSIKGETTATVPKQGQMTFKMDMKGEMKGTRVSKK